jgi:hypothetical protein
MTSVPTVVASSALMLNVEMNRMIGNDHDYCADDHILVFFLQKEFPLLVKTGFAPCLSTRGKHCSSSRYQFDYFFLGGFEFIDQFGIESVDLVVLLDEVSADREPGSTIIFSSSSLFEIRVLEDVLDSHFSLRENGRIGALRECEELRFREDHVNALLLEGRDFRHESVAHLRQDAQDDESPVAM